jgi:hypothetical protein
MSFNEIFMHLRFPLSHPDTLCCTINSRGFFVRESQVHYVNYYGTDHGSPEDT